MLHYPEQTVRKLADAQRAFRRAYDTDFPDQTAEQQIATLDKVREIVLAQPERLRMRTWHSMFFGTGMTDYNGVYAWRDRTCDEEIHACGTAHCVAGWAQVCASDQRLRGEFEPESAGVLLAPIAYPMFFTDESRALKYLTDREYVQQLAEAATTSAELVAIAASIDVSGLEG